MRFLFVLIRVIRGSFRCPEKNDPRNYTNPVVSGFFPFSYAPLTISANHNF